MARASLQIDLSALDELQKKLSDPHLMEQLRNIAGMKEVAALVAQAIADNFAQQGPGWEPLSPATIRRSVAKKLRKAIDKMSDAQLLAREASARDGDVNAPVPYRQILRRTSLLFQTVTTPGFVGSSVENKPAISNERRGKLKKAQTGRVVTGANIYRTEGTNLIWGTNLIYAGVHNNGHDSKPKVPQREFLVIRDQWKIRLEKYIFEVMKRLVAFNLEP